MIRRDIYINREYRGHEQGLSIYHKNEYSYVTMSTRFPPDGSTPAEAPTFKRFWSYFRNPINATVLKKRGIV